MRFTKMHGLGNDFLVVDERDGDGVEWASVAPGLCDRRTGVGADGVLLVGRASSDRMSMRLVNADGTEAEMCGNGVRCAAVWAASRGFADERATWETAAGVIATELLDGGMVRVDMGPPRFAPAEIPVDLPGDTAPPLRVELGGDRALDAFAVGMGNPHCVVVLDPTAWAPLADADAAAIAEHVRTAIPFPQGVNVEIVEVLSLLALRQRTVERGVGETDACGTGACAAVAALRRAGRIAASGEVTVELRGGPLLVDWAGSGPVLMTGPAVAVFEGEVDVPLDAGRSGRG